MARPATQMFGHLPGLFQQLLGIAHHLRVSAQHHVAGVGVHRQANGLFQRRFQSETAPGRSALAVSRLTTV
jgi:hypothetical protein